MSFLDHFNLNVFGGRGGNGLVSFRTARHRPRLGPDGGNGGRGGDVWFHGTDRLHTFEDLLCQKNFRAESGKSGRPLGRKGCSGKSMVIDVPLGTKIYEGDHFLGEILEKDQKILAARGGGGGLGNRALTTSTMRAPRVSTPGKPGEEKKLFLSLSLLADVALVGFPNVGKSTFLAQVTEAQPKIGDYPFTTLSPHLGVLENAKSGIFQRLVLADIPGLIEGASQGKGLGHRFLQHIRRCRGLVFILDGGMDLTPVEQVRILEGEIAAYDSDLLKSPKAFVLNKQDLWAGTEDQLPPGCLFMSARDGVGLEEVLEKLWKSFA